MSVATAAEAATRTILVVDDEAAILEIVARMLRYRGHQVLVATSGARGVELCAAHHEPVDLLITDVTMPGQSGTDLAGQLMGRYANLRVLFISGNADPTPSDADSRTSFLQKPFTIGELAAAVSELFSREPSRPHVS